ncbi:serine protease [Vibrio sp. UCD-FRSSP16_10]|uniref:patatin-like phospholipase family protein n=1 Tax=unclassified Vibrio TaxID=2614977 RepID=UPI0007FCB2BA|nr:MULTISPECIES: patatin-like phospholipase family protein [unclassified Vibrio]OBT17280.1 serine protease [Vibrio sp. UCD-FRSSP16_30]OBT23049.1 serine protease [Vibrio sp. UCD-FRSSP16_10]
MLRNAFVIGIIGLFTLAVSTSAAFATESYAQHSKTRPTMGVVLAGGGAKGAAHIGVLKALEEMRIPVDIITGTSMGSYVGGLYATGQSADQIESYLTDIDWNLGYRDQVVRADRRIRDKAYEDRYQINADLGVGWGTIKTPKGVVQGQGMLRILRETSHSPLDVDSFDDFAIRYRAVATDIVNLKEVVIDKGYLVDAMMASMSVPGALPPYELNGQLLVDGGVVNNMPVDLTQQMGADYIIAVDISSDYKTKEELASFLDVGGQLSNYLVQRGTVEQGKLLHEQDVLLSPDVGQIGTTDFSAMPDAYQRGYEEAMKHKQELAKFALSEEDYAEYQNQKAEKAQKIVFGDDLLVDKIEMINQSHFNPEVLNTRLGLEAEDNPTAEDIENGVSRLYALDRFEKITYKYDQRDLENTLVIDVDEKDWGPNYLNFRFFLEDDFTTTSQYAIGGSANFTDLGWDGGEARTSVELGTDKLVAADLYTPFFSNQVLFNTLLLQYSDETRNVALSSIKGEEITDLSDVSNYLPVTYSEFKVDMSIGLQPALWNQLSVGLRYTSGRAGLSTISSGGYVSYDRKGIYLRYVADTLDSASLPTEGHYLLMEYLTSFDDVNDATSSYEEERVDEYKVRWVSAVTFLQKHTLVGNAEVGIFNSENNIVPIDPYDLGGFQHLSGIPRNSLIGQNKAFAMLVYRYRWFENDFGMFKSPIYVGMSAEYGGVWSGSDRSFDNVPLFVAGSAYIGIDSPLGPVLVGYGQTENGMGAAYLSIGTQFK